MRIPSGGPRVTYAIPAPPADFVPYPPARVVEPSHLSDRAERVIGFDDLPAENPDLLTADPQPAPVVKTLAPSPLRAGHEHAGPVLRGLRTETPRLQAPDEHTVHHQLPHGAQLRIVPLTAPADDAADAPEGAEETPDLRAAARDMQMSATEAVLASVPDTATAAFDFELELVYLACAISDLKAMPVRIPQIDGTEALIQAFEEATDLLVDFAPMLPAGVSEWDHRPVTPAVGFDLETAVAA